MSLRRGAVSDSACCGRSLSTRDTLAEGETSTVYQAVDIHLRRSVTVRILNPEHAGDPEAVQRFLDAARLSAAYSHPNVASTYDVAIESGVPYVVAEHVEGERLADIIRNQAPLQTERLRQIGSQLALALDYAQRHDSVDYGLASNDVIVTWGDHVKVLAFRRDLVVPKDPERTVRPPLTRSGTAQGIIHLGHSSPSEPCPWVCCCMRWPQVATHSV